MTAGAGGCGTNNLEKKKLLKVLRATSTSQLAFAETVPLAGAGRHDARVANARARTHAQSCKCKQLFDVVILTSAGSSSSPVALIVVCKSLCWLID